MLLSTVLELKGSRNRRIANGLGTLRQLNIKRAIVACFGTVGLS